MHKNSVKHRHSHSDYDLQADLRKIKEALSDTGRDVRGRAGEFISQSFDDVKETSAAVQSSVTNYVSEKPFKSLGLAVLFGALLGFFLRK